jgi:hypothetical protein
MFGVDWGNPETLWLNLTNLGLGIVLLVCVAAVAYGVILDLIDKRKAAAGPNIDEEVNRMLAQMKSAHAFHSPELGMTMADGGEPEKPKQRKPGKKS